MAIVLKTQNSDAESVKIYPLVPLREGVIFPLTEAVLTFGRPVSIAGINDAAQKEMRICFVSQKNRTIKNPESKDIYSVGTICKNIKTLPVNNE